VNGAVRIGLGHARQYRQRGSASSQMQKFAAGKFHHASAYSSVLDVESLVAALIISVAVSRCNNDRYWHLAGIGSKPVNVGFGP
jgi:hypothetical protein